MMRTIYLVTGLAIFSIIAAAVFAIMYDDAAKPWIDAYGNLASMLGLMVSVGGFALTVWTIAETLRVTKKTQEELRLQIEKSRQELRQQIDSNRKETINLLASIRAKSLDDTCFQASSDAAEARAAIQSASWQLAIEKCRKARKFALHLLGYPLLIESEVLMIRGITEDLKTLIAFIEKNKLKEDASKKMPHDKIAPLSWELARFGSVNDVASINEGANRFTYVLVSASEVRAAKRAIKCGELGSYLRNIDRPLSVDAIASNFLHALSWTTMSFSSNPLTAAHQLCGH